MSQTLQHQVKPSTDVAPPVQSELQLQRRAFPHEVESSTAKAGATPTPISADWQAQQEKMARARFNPSMISLYPVDPVKDDRKEKPIQKQAEETREPEEQDRPIQRQPEETAAEKEQDNPVQRQPQDPEPKEKDEPIQRRTEEPEAEEKNKPIQRQPQAPETEEKEKPIQRQSEAADQEAQPQLQRQAADEPEEDAAPAKSVQTKLTVGRAGDRYEQEADRVAAKVMTMPDPTRNRIQRQTEDTDVQPKLASTITPFVQRQSDEAVQTKAGRSAQNQSVNAEFENRLAGSKGSGSPLPSDVRSFMEPRFGVDLSHVRVHTGADAAQMNKDVRAQAFTYRNHIFYSAGKSPGKDDLTAHELTHVIQQTGGKLKKEVRRSPDENDSVQPKSLESHPPATENKVTPAETSVQRHNISRVSPQIQGDWWTDAKERAGDVGSAIRGGAEVIGDVATGDIEGAKRRLLDSVSRFAADVPGYPLLTVILGKDPIKDKPVERNATNVVKGILDLIPNGKQMFKNLQESGVLQKAFDWFEQAWGKLNLTWDFIKSLFRRAIDALSVDDILNPGGLIEELANLFRKPIQRITRFAIAAGEKVLEFIFEGAMALAGKGGADRVLGIMKQVKSSFMKIVKDPIGFVRNLINAVKGGFQNFARNIVKHLKAGLVGWLLGALSGAGLQLPTKFDLKGILSLVLQVIGATYQKLRKKLVKRIGEKKVSQVEKGFELLRSIASGGLAAAWKQIAQFAGNFQEMVMSAIRDWVITKIVQSAITKLVSMFNPAGAVVQAVMAIYNTVMFFIERMQQIMELANAVFNSINNIAAGKIGAAIKFVEQTMAKALPVIISFLARLIGLGGISKKIRDIIKRMQRPIDRALDRIIEMVMKFGKRLKNKSNNKQENSSKKKRKDLEAAEREVKEIIANSKTTKEVEKSFPKIKRKFKLKKLEWNDLGRASASIKLKINPDAEITDLGNSLALSEPDTSHCNMHDQDVTFKTLDVQTPSGLVSVGKTMLAAKLGPNHPRGSDKIRYKLEQVMSYLSTAENTVNSYQRAGDRVTLARPKMGKERKYVKGHLLNAKLGGPADDRNLFPITSFANGQHETVERDVINWVNKQGYWVYYKVDVKPTLVDVGRGVFNSVLHCEASKLNAQGERVPHGAINAEIPSEIHAQARRDDLALNGRSFSTVGQPERDPNFDPSKVHW